MSSSGIPDELKRYLPKSKRERNREKLGRRLSRLINPLTRPFKYAMRYENGAWTFARSTEKPKKFRQTFNDNTPRWNLDGAGPLPMDENTVLRMIEMSETGGKEAPSGKNRGKPRRYIPAGTSLEGFFDRLNEAGIRYAVLRWFDNLPVPDPSENLVLLVEDSAFDRLDEFFERSKTGNAIPCDVYTASGIPGTTFEGIPYFEKRIADQILDNTILHAGRFKIPDPRHHFLSLAYHAAYHKAHASGLPFRDGEPPLASSNGRDYAGILGNLAEQLGHNFMPNMEAIHRLLRDEGWAPRLDTIRKLSVKRPVLTRILDDAAMKDTAGPNLCVFVVRQWAEKCQLIPWIAANIRFFGFDIKRIHMLSPDGMEKATSNIRGGNWNRGPYPVSGGPPRAIIVAYDYTPEPPDSDMVLNQPFAANARFVMLKKILRDGINNNLPNHLHVNGVHTADDDLEAWEYLQISAPECIDEIRDAIGQGYQGDPYLRLKLHQGKRATSYLVYRDRKPCVLKVFADSGEGQQCYAAEKLAHDLFQEKSWEPGWLEFGPNWMLQRFHDQSRRLDRVAPTLEKKEKTAIAKQVVKMLKDIHASGHAHRDIHAQNIFLTENGIALIDFETLCPQPKTVKFAESYDITGKGLATPFGTGRMGFDNQKNPRSLRNTLGVSASSILSS